MPDSTLILCSSLIFSFLMAGFLILVPDGLKTSRTAIWIWIGGELAFAVQRLILLSRSGQLLHPYISSDITDSTLNFLHAMVVSLGIICEILAIKVFQKYQPYSKRTLYLLLLLPLLIALLSNPFATAQGHHTALLLMFGGLTLWQSIVLWPLVTHSNGAKMLFGVNIWIVQYSLFLLLSLWLPTTHGFFTFSESAAVLNDFASSLVKTLAFALMISERSYQNISNISTTDLLTGIPNRRAMMSLLERVWRDAMNRRQPFVVALFDIDHFKQINDKYGHDTGDDMLHALANRVNALKRTNDTFARWGGEEFMLVLSNMHENDAVMAIARICSEISQKPLIEGIPIITVSTGVIAYPSKNIDGLRDLLSKLDECLYQAKINRNCTVFFNLNQKANPVQISA